MHLSEQFPQVPGNKQTWNNRGKINKKTKLNEINQAYNDKVNMNGMLHCNDFHFFSFLYTVQYFISRISFTKSYQKSTGLQNVFQNGISVFDIVYMNINTMNPLTFCVCFNLLSFVYLCTFLWNSNVKWKSNKINSAFYDYFSFLCLIISLFLGGGGGDSSGF